MTHERSDPAACTNNIRDPVLRKKKLQETIEKKKQHILQYLDQIYLLMVEVRECDDEIEVMKNGKQPHTRKQPTPRQDP